MASPILSVIITTCNTRPASLLQALDSIISACSGPLRYSVEIILVCDKLNICPENALYHYILANNVIIIEFPFAKHLAHYTGVSAGRNLGILKANGQWIFFLDDDDLLVADGFHSLIRQCFLAPHAKTIIASGYIFAEVADLNDPKLTFLYQRLADEHSLSTLNKQNCLAIGGYAIRSSSIRHMFNDYIKSHEDWLFLLQNSTDDCFLVLGKPSVIVRSTANSRGKKRDPSEINKDLLHIRQITDYMIES